LSTIVHTTRWFEVDTQRRLKDSLAKKLKIVIGACR